MALLLRATGLLAAAGSVPLPPAPGWEYVGGAWAEDKANGGVAREQPHPTLQSGCQTAGPPAQLSRDAPA